MLTYLFWILAIVLGLAGLFVLICIPHNLRVRRVRQVYRCLPSEVVQQVVELIQQAAAHGPSVTFLRLAEDVVCDGNVLLQSHVGGVPYAESGDEWPQGTPEGEPAKFMLQVRLDHRGSARRRGQLDRLERDVATGPRSAALHRLSNERADLEPVVRAGRDVSG